MSDGTEKVNLCINQSATFERLFFWYQGCKCRPIGAPRGLPMDLTGYSAAMQIRPFALSDEVLYDASSNITLGGVFGTIQLLIPSYVTKEFTWWRGVYDMILQSPTGFATRFLMGQVNVSPSVTNYTEWTADSDTGADSILTVGG